MQWEGIQCLERSLPQAVVVVQTEIMAESHYLEDLVAEVVVPLQPMLQPRAELRLRLGKEVQVAMERLLMPVQMRQVVVVAGPVALELLHLLP